MHYFFFYRSVPMNHKHSIKIIWRWLYIVEDAGRVATIVAMTAIIFGQVMLRIFFNWSSPAWEESARFIMIWSIFIGAIVTTREDGHIKMGGVFRSAKKLIIFDVISKFLCLAFMAIFIKWSYEFALYSLAKSMQSIVLRVPLILVHICFFVCGLFIALHFLVHLINRIRGFLKFNRGGTQC